MSLDCVSTMQAYNSNVQLFSNQKCFAEEKKYNVQHPCKLFGKLGIKIMAQLRPFVYVPMFEQIFGFF